MKHTESTFTGFLNIYKEAGFTSHDVVAKLRGILRQKKIGHLGTLDPNAEGVLPVALGRATKAISLLEDHTKAYDAVLLLGKETDTYDSWGETTETHPVKVTEEEIRRVIASFQGEQLQVPPMYSAKKQHGKRLYELAREGKIVEREAVPICIDEISIRSIELPRVTFHVECSKGTYIRSLCHDIGTQLSCGGCMEALLRTRAGSFSLEDAHRLSEIEAWMQQYREPSEYDVSENLKKTEKALPYLIPIEQGFSHLPSIFCKNEVETRLINGGDFSLLDITRINLPRKLLRDEFRTDQTMKATAENVDVTELWKDDSLSFWLNNKSTDSSKTEENSASEVERIFSKLRGINGLKKNTWIRVYLSDNKFLGIYIWSGKKFYPRKVFI